MVVGSCGGAAKESVVGKRAAAVVCGVLEAEDNIKVSIPRQFNMKSY